MADASTPFVAGVVVAATVGFQLALRGAAWLGPLVLPAIFAKPSAALPPLPSPTPGKAFDDEIAAMRRVIETNASTTTANAAAIAIVTSKVDNTVTRLDQLSSDFSRSGKRLDELAADVRATREELVEARVVLTQIGVRAEERERARLEQLQALARGRS